MFKNLETERLYLKNISSDDREFIFSQFSDDTVNKYLFDAEPLTDIVGADEIIDFYIQPEPRLQNRWILVRKSDGVKMGTCGFHNWDYNNQRVDIGYDLKKEFWNNGYMSEAIKEIIDFAIKNMSIKEINACIYVDNNKSMHLADKFGFVKNGTYYEIFRNEKYLHNIYTLFIK